MFEFKPTSSEPCRLCYSSLAPKSKSHLLENHLNHQLEPLREDNLFLFSTPLFFPKCPQCQKPRGHLGSIETTFLDGVVKTHTSENILLAGFGEPLSKSEEQPRVALQGGCSGLGRGVLSAGVQCEAWLLGRWLDDGV